MKTTIYCNTTAKDTQSYFLRHGAKEYFLFNSAFRRSNKDFFGNNGVRLDDALAAKSNYSASVRKVAAKLLGAIRYLENEYGIVVLDKTANKSNKTRKGYNRNRYMSRYLAEAV